MGEAFAGATAGFAASRFAIFGAPYDGQAQPGARLGPEAIRRASHKGETFNLRAGVDLAQVPIHDAGDADLDEKSSPETMVKRVGEFAGRIVSGGKVPVLLGGEQSTVAGVVASLKKRFPGLACVHLDAHLDYLEADRGETHARGCVSRRVAEILTPERTAVLGVRSASRREWEEARRDGLFFLTSFDIQASGVSRALDRTMKAIGPGPVYLTIDIDALDPSHAPATGRPEPYGLTPQDVLACLQRFAPRLVGFDVTEVAPASDSGKTASLAARLVNEGITEIWTKSAGGAAAGSPGGSRGRAGKG